MKKLGVFMLVSAFFWSGVQADSHGETEGNFYVGLGYTVLELDGDRVPGVAVSSPGHAPKIGSLILGYRFNDLWSADLSLGTDIAGNAETDAVVLNGYRYFGVKTWKPYVSAGVSSFSVNDAVDGDTQQLQAGFGVAGDLSRNMELRAGYQSFFAISGDSYQDNALGISLAWHFKAPESVAAAEPAPAPAPAPEPVELQRVELVVQFEFDSSDVRSLYEEQFSEIARLLRENPGIDLTIEGHTCWIGPEDYNLGLSQRRAEAVMGKFVSQFGISADRISAVGFGESQPVADNNTLAGRQANRRAIAVILKPVVQ